MSESAKAKFGRIAWADLTIPNAVQTKDFYKAVVGWESQGVGMGSYEDFCMMPPGEEEPVAGICHAVGTNANLPPQWLLYVTVENLEASMKAATETGGKLVTPVRDMGPWGKMCVIQDPAGAVMAIVEPPKAAQ